jgi:hypothetical protein
MSTIVNSDLNMDSVAKVINLPSASLPLDAVNKTDLDNGLLLKVDKSTEIFLSTTVIQSSTSTTYANVTQLTTSSLAIGTYYFNVIALCQSTATNTGLGLRISNATATISSVLGKWMIGQAADGTSKNYQYDQLSATTNASSASAAAANSDFIVHGQGKFVVSVAGTVAVQLRSETGTSVSIRPNSVLILKKVA